MANILVHIELRERAATPSSLYVLNVGRQIASELGATLHALLPCDSPPSYQSDDSIAVLSRHGADKVTLITGPSLVEPALYASHGEAIVAACAQIKPRLVLFAASPASDELAPRVATQLGANYFPNVRFASEGGEFRMAGEAFRRRFRVVNPLRGAGRVVVAAVVQTAAPRIVGEDDAEVVMMHGPSTSSPHVRVLGRRPAPSAELCHARVVVGGGAGLPGKEGLELLRRLATALGGACAVSPSLCSREQAEPSLRFGLDGNATAAELYLAVGVSGSERHLAGLAPRTVVAAVNSDPGAPILDCASYGLIADSAETIRALLHALEGAA